MQKWTKQQCDEYDEARNIYMECKTLRERMSKIERINNDWAWCESVIYGVRKTVNKSLNLALKMMEEKLMELTNQLKCTCQIPNGTDSCHACLNQWRNERYGYPRADWSGRSY
tara:strand:- start:270 stop:608 length:339 start_codon:yes stop_codon:yes gene_type:complete